MRLDALHVSVLPPTARAAPSGETAHRPIEVLPRELALVAVRPAPAGAAPFLAQLLAQETGGRHLPPVRERAAAYAAAPPRPALDLVA